MTKSVLLAAVGLAALTVATPAAAQQYNGGGHDNDPSLNVDVDYDSYVNSDIDSDVEYRKDVELEGDVDLRGDIRVDSSAVAINDPAQMLDDINIDATGDNRVREFDIGGEGNVGVNLAAGTLNQQMNSAVMSVSDYVATDNQTFFGGDHHDGDNGGSSGGWAEATTTSVQSLNDLTYDPKEDRDGHGGHHESFDGNYDNDDGSNIANRVAGGTVGGSGNVGVNAAAGAFNQQANLLTMATATNSALAEANAGLLQTAQSSDIEATTGNNVVGGLTIDAGATGNIGVNLAAGVGNQQVNSLTIANTSTN